MGGVVQIAGDASVCSVTVTGAAMARSPARFHYWRSLK